jgi:hypothetical protein
LLAAALVRKKKNLKRASSIKVKRNVFGNTHMARPWEQLMKIEAEDDDRPLSASLSANALKRLRESQTKREGSKPQGCNEKPQVAKGQMARDGGCKPKGAQRSGGQKPGQKRKKKNGSLEFEEYSPEFLEELAKRGITLDMIKQARNDMLSEG